ncbi:MAG: PEP-CTERM sorting domain-containing protein [Opitutaceae bacterium]|jgi:hypothetical protein
MNTALKNSFPLLALVIALLGTPALRSQTLTFTVDLNTAALSADSANAPFYLDFTMDYGNSALASNTATLSSFVLTGGTAVGSATTSGSATGSLGTTVALTANSTHPESEFYQQFSSGVTNITFNATVTETGPDVGTPTEFTASILDSSLGFPAQLFTTAPDTGSLVTLDLNASNTQADVGAFSSLSSADGLTAVTGVTASLIPEPSTTAAMFGGAAAIAALYLRRSRKGQTA